MKKILFVLLGVLIITTGCFKSDVMEDINIITTIYPIQYVTQRLYGENSKIESIYPKGVLAKDYILTKKQLKDFSNNDLFIYNGSTDEREYATTMLNRNNNLKIIDASYGLDATYSKTDIWLNPSNILMIAQNIRNELESYISNPYLVNDITTKYETLKVDITELETEFKKTADNSTDKRIISSNESLRFLEKYGFQVINLTENGEANENNIELAKSLLKNGTLSVIFITEDTSSNEVVTSLKTSYPNTSLLTFNTLENITEANEKSNDDYLSIMHTNLELIKQEVYK